MDRISRGLPIDIYGDGSTRRDYTYVGDVVRGILASVDHAKGMGYQIFNLGNSQTVTLTELVDAIGVALNVEPVLRHRPEQLGDVKITFANIEKARHMLDFSPATPLDRGLTNYVSWLKSEGLAYASA
jgi:UDP-glucuronate 4-epimerase